jgi:2-polyprenyl-6-methoxyphenol hydroxylase-like FAD-dependent oxidoreductase
MLSTNLAVEFDKQFEHYEETESGVTAFFSDGSLAKGDILVGADGSHSLGRFWFFFSFISFFFPSLFAELSRSV